MLELHRRRSRTWTSARNIIFLIQVRPWAHEEPWYYWRGHRRFGLLSRHVVVSLAHLCDLQQRNTCHSILHSRLKYSTGPCDWAMRSKTRVGSTRSRGCFVRCESMRFIWSLVCCVCAARIRTSVADARPYPILIWCTITRELGEHTRCPWPTQRRSTPYIVITFASGSSGS